MQLKQPTHPRSYFLNPVQKLTERIELTLDEIDLFSTTVHVSANNKAPEEVGSPVRPFKTIQAAIDAIVAAGDNGPSKSYVIYVMPGIYNENIVFNSDKLVCVSITSRGSRYLGLDVVINGSLTCTQNNDGFNRLMVEGVSIGGDVIIEGASDNTSAFSNELVFASCCLGNVTFKNVVCGVISNCKSGGTFTFENVPCGEVHGTPGHSPGSSVSVIYDSSHNKPNSMYGDYTYVMFDNAIVGYFDVSRIGDFGASTLQLRKGTRSGNPAATSTVGPGATLSIFDATIRGSVINNGNMIFTDGSVAGDVINNGAATLGGGSFISGAWTGNPPTLDQRSCFVKNDSNVPGLTIKDALDYVMTKLPQ